MKMLDSYLITNKG